jgi:hypothetical protein
MLQALPSLAPANLANLRVIVFREFPLVYKLTHCKGTIIYPLNVGDRDTVWHVQENLAVLKRPVPCIGHFLEAVI